MTKYTANKLEDLKSIAKNILSEFNLERTFAFYGKMGSGKTTFIKELCKQLGVNETITSPTFSIINEYTGKENYSIYHFDFYRIKSQEEAYDFGYEEYLFANNYCFIEWPELIENLLPINHVKISITEKENGNRIFITEKMK